jgi:hypothetical protein
LVPLVVKLYIVGVCILDNVYPPTYPPPIPQSINSSRSVASSNLQKSDIFKFGGENIYQRYIPDDIWKQIKKNKMSYLSKIPLYIDIINKWNEKFINIAKNNEEWEKQKKKNPNIRIKEEEAFLKKEKENKEYWDNQKRTRSDMRTISEQEIEAIGEIPSSWDRVKNSLGNDNMDMIDMAEGYGKNNVSDKSVTTYESPSDKSATTYEYPSDKPLSSKGPPVKENLQESIKKIG